MARVLFALALPAIAAPGGGVLAGWLLTGALLCLLGWLLFGPGGRWL